MGRRVQYEHIRTRFAILYAVCTDVVWHAGAIALCLPTTTSIASALDLALIVDGLWRERAGVMNREHGCGGVGVGGEGVGDFYDVGGVDGVRVVGLHGGIVDWMGQGDIFRSSVVNARRNSRSISQPGRVCYSCC